MQTVWIMKYARYGPTDHYEIPEAGVCLSVFAVVANSDDAVLVGIPKGADRWQDEWLYSKKKENSEIFEQWRVPSGYLMEGEHPEAALARVMREQLGIEKYAVASGPRILSYYSPSDWYPGQSHWDLAFVYRVKIENSQPLKQWWSELEFSKIEKLKEKDYGWNADFMDDLIASMTQRNERNSS
jgi:ADP-ribose pyrophosphatase YjhB (NUDIX family)